jgi:hypothetical protein
MRGIAGWCLLIKTAQPARLWVKILQRKVAYLCGYAAIENITENIKNAPKPFQYR